MEIVVSISLALFYYIHQFINHGSANSGYFQPNIFSTNTQLRIKLHNEN